MTELGKRVLVVVVGVPIVAWLLYLGGWYLALPLAALAGLGASELYRMTTEIGPAPFSWAGALASAAFVLSAAGRPAFEDFAPVALAMIAALTVVTVIAAIFARGPKRMPLSVVAVTLFGAVYTGLSLSVVPLLHVLPELRGWEGSAGDPWSGLVILALPLAATWCGDIAAFFAGSAWGEAKLAPAISPNKSWVGFWAALAAAGGAAAIWFLVAQPRLPGLRMGLATTVGLGVLLGLGAVLGDLAESLMKREAGVKDSGAFFPGHGGIMDRLDALYFTLPMTYAALALLGGAR